MTQTQVTRTAQQSTYLLIYPYSQPLFFLLHFSTWLYSATIEIAPTSDTSLYLCHMHFQFSAPLRLKEHRRQGPHLTYCKFPADSPRNLKQTHKSKQPHQNHFDKQSKGILCGRLSSSSCEWEMVFRKREINLNVLEFHRELIAYGNREPHKNRFVKENHA